MSGRYQLTEREDLALTLRKRGLSFSEIAREMKISTARAHNLVHAAEWRLRMQTKFGQEKT